MSKGRTCMQLQVIFDEIPGGGVCVKRIIVLIAIKLGSWKVSWIKSCGGGLSMLQYYGISTTFCSYREIKNF